MKGEKLRHPIAKFKCPACGHFDYRMSAMEVGELVERGCPNCGKDVEVVEAGDIPPQLLEIEGIVGKHFGILDFVFAKDQMELEVEAPKIKPSFSEVLKKLRRKGYIAALRRRDGELWMRVLKFQPPERGGLLLDTLLPLATLATTFATYLMLSGDALGSAIFSGAVLLMLGSHELGHKMAARRHGIDVSMPYFIPGPPLLGTFGTVMKVRSPIPTKEALVEIGAWGPILGFLVALPLALIGSSIPNLGWRGLPSAQLIAPLVLAALGQIAPAAQPNPLVFAGWVMLVVTFLNLMPAGQLDGGHILRGILSVRWHYGLTKALGFILLISGLFAPLILGLPLMLWGLLILFSLGARYHAGALDDVSELAGNRKALAAAAFVVLILCLPVPVGQVT